MLTAYYCKDCDSRELFHDKKIAQNADFEKYLNQYDVIHLKNIGHVFNPRSIVCTMMQQDYNSFWTRTETYETLKNYISANFDGLKDAIVQMLGGMRCRLNANTFQNDMTSMQSKDDIMTLLVHLGYLRMTGRKKKSMDLLEATWEMDTNYIAKALLEMHSEAASILQYNDENALSCAITLAYYSAREYYTICRELPRGRGFADMVFLPNKNVDKPALVVELKWNQDAAGAIQQIKDKKYTQHLQNFAGEILLIGINYQKKKEQYECMIETYRK